MASRVVRLLSANVRPAFEPVGAERALRAVDSWLARPVDDLARLGQKMTPAPDDLWRFNPFYEWPIAILADGTYATPSPLGVLQRFGPQGLYFIWERRCGRRCQPEWVPQRSQETWEVGLSAISEFSLGSSGTHSFTPRSSTTTIRRASITSSRLPKVLVLVEAKSVAPNIYTRSGVFPEDGEIQKKIERACRQITNSASLIERGHPRFLLSRQVARCVASSSPESNTSICPCRSSMLSSLHPYPPPSSHHNNSKA